MTDIETPARATADDIKRFEANLQNEVDGGALYRLLADAEDNPNLKEIFHKIAASEDRHRALWEQKLREAGANIPNFSPTRRVRVLGWLARRFGTGAISPIVARMEMDATGMYDNQPEAVDAGLPAEEQSHARLFREISRSGRGAASATNIATIEGRHRGGTGNALRAAVLGVNDGLVSNLSLVLGVAGASPGRDFVLLAGIASWLAGAFSMAMGEWISVQSSRESFARQIAVEREELELMPEEEEAELTLIYQAKGFSRDEAKTLAARIVSNKDTALDTLAREELGMSPDEAGDPYIAAATSFGSFTVGAIIPVLPWLFAGGFPAIALSAVLAGLALFAVGAITTLFTGIGVFFSGARQLVVGLGLAAITFGTGKVIGATTGL
ncbi:MAG: VIT1/CCC1 transporter family protein [Chloroflexi bacterium]|nr:VIT1/CCC1 transporter family protein [Chloroflexota bacterium]